MITLNQSMRIEQNYVRKILIVLLFIIHIITEDFSEGIAYDVTKWFDTSNYDKNDKKTSSNRYEQKSI